MAHGRGRGARKFWPQGFEPVEHDPFTGTWNGHITVFGWYSDGVQEAFYRRCQSSSTFSPADSVIAPDLGSIAGPANAIGWSNPIGGAKPLEREHPLSPGLLRIGIAAGLVLALSGGWASSAQNNHSGATGVDRDQYIARFVNGMFTFISPQGKVEGFDLRPTFFFLTSQFSNDGTTVAGFADSTFTVLNRRLETLWTRRTMLLNVTDLAVSPGGTRVAYLNLLKPGSEARELGYLNETSSATTLATVTLDAEDRGASISWDGTGDRIVFESDGDIAIVGIDGRGRERIGRGCAPSWSPDGLKIAYRDNDGYGVIHDVGSGSSRRLSFTRSRCAAFHWSPDSRLVFTREHSDAPSDDCFDDDRFIIYRIEDGFRQGRYTPCGLRDDSFGWLRDRNQWRKAVVDRAAGRL
jgi:WD40-like Beta Propeller Repeat